MGEPLLVDSDAMDALCQRLAAAELAIGNIAVPAQELCTGPFVRCSNRTGWWNTFSSTGGTTNWTQVFNNTGNVANTVGDWVDVGSAQTAPDCVTDLEFDADLGNHLIYARRNRAYLWWDVQLLVNGAVVSAGSIGTYDRYHYRDERTNTNPDEVEPLQYHIEPTGHVNGHRLAIPAGATVQVQSRPRYQTAASQASNYFRTIVGLRSNTTYKFWPRQIVIGRM